METRRTVLKYIAGTAGMAACGLDSLEGFAQGSPSPTMTDAQVRVRADRLIAQMTPEEKTGQLIKYNGLAISEARAGEEIKAGRVGSLAYITKPEMINQFQKIAMDESRLKIPLLFAMDTIHGQNTIFPVPIGMAASWDPKLEEEVYRAAAREARSVGLTWVFAPMLDIARDARWGRIVEGAGEDPFLGAAMAVAQVRGLQGPAIGSPGHVIAGPKHFGGYGASLGGRDYAEANISDTDLWNVYFPPFEAAFKAGAGNVMTAYMALNGVPASANKWLLTDVLRKDWGFKGFVVTDANAINSLVTQGFADDVTDAGARALRAGVDMESGFGVPAFSKLPAALAAGKIDTEMLDDAVRRVLEMKIRMGLFEYPYVDEANAQKVLADPDTRKLAEKAAERTAVLLRNEDGLLPLSREQIKSIAVIGQLADSPHNVLGPWALTGDVAEALSILSGIRAKAGTNITVSYAPGIKLPERSHSPFDAMLAMLGNKPEPALQNFDPATELHRAIDLAAKSDVSVLVLGESAYMEGESASRSTLELPGDQQQLLEAVAAQGKPVVLLLMAGRPLEIRWASTHVGAIMDIWYPGSRGGAAVANLLFGDVAPGGKLPFTWVRDAGQIPFPYDQLISQQPATDSRRYINEESTPVYPFGHGLSYTTFKIDNLHIDRMSSHITETITVSVDIQNTGNRQGNNVIQLYLHQRYGSACRPRRELKAFQRIELSPAEKRTINFQIGPTQRQYWSEATRSVVVEPAKFDVWVGDSSDALLTAQFEVRP